MIESIFCGWGVFATFQPNKKINNFNIVFSLILEPYAKELFFLFIFLIL